LGRKDDDGNGSSDMIYRISQDYGNDGSYGYNGNGSSEMIYRALQDCGNDGIWVQRQRLFDMIRKITAPAKVPIQPCALPLP
jgi:hypothetical protein